METLTSEDRPIGRSFGPLSLRLLSYPAGTRLPRHHHAHASISLMLEGNQRERTGAREFDCDKYCALLKPRDIEHSNEVGSTTNRGLFVEMSSAMEAELCDAGGARLDVRCFADGTTRHYVRRIRRELMLNQPGAYLVIEGLLFELLGTFARIQRFSTLHDHDVRLARAVEYIEAHFRERITLVDVAKKCEVNPSVLAQSFRNEYGTSVGEWIRNRRLERAREILRNAAVPISSIAFDMGFADQSHLTRLFHARFGVTPAEYRRSVS